MQDLVALIYHAVAQLSPEDIFGAGSPLIAINQPEDGRIASTGWVGKRYQDTRIVFMGVNPGGGTSSYISPRPDDVHLYRLLRSFKNANKDEEIHESFGTLCEEWINLQRKHNIWRIISPLLDALKINAEHIAYLNLVPFRTREDKSPDRHSYMRAWKLASGKQIDALKPRKLILLGKKVTDAFTKLDAQAKEYEIISVQRTIGDSYLSTQALEVIERFKAKH